MTIMGNAPAAQDLIQPAGLHHLVVPVRIVQLDLDELYLRVLVQHLFKQLGRAVIGKAEVANLPGRLFRHGPLEAVVFLIGVEVLSVLQAVQQVEVEIFDAAPRELFAEDAIPVLRPVHHSRGELGRQGKALPGIAPDQRLLNGALRVSAVVDIGGVEVVESLFHAGVHHVRRGRRVDAAACFREAHRAK